MWRNWLARIVWDDEAESSSLTTPTRYMKNKLMLYRRLVYLIIIIFIIISIYYYFHPFQTTVFIKNIPIYVDLAINDTERQKGLGEREHLDDGRGMLFVFPNPEKFQFWMKDMQFPLDFIWIKDNVVIDLTKNVPIYTDGVYTRLQPSEPVNKILEVNAGFIDKNQIQIGDPIVIRN